MTTVILGNSQLELPKIPSNSVDMVFTSPPYAQRRAKAYGGIPAHGYTRWFKSFAIQIKRVLKPTGSFFLNIKSHTEKGERHLYVMDLVLDLKVTVGFRFVDEFCWVRQAFPGGYKGRFKNAFESVYHFTIDHPNSITFNPTACGTPMKEESIARAHRKQCGAPKNGSGMTGMDITNIRHLKLARPSNVIYANNISNQHTLRSGHPAVFPNKLVEFFVKSFTNKGDVVLDPFAGSGTVGEVCMGTNRDCILIEKEPKYIKLINKRLNESTEYKHFYTV